MPVQSGVEETPLRDITLIFIRHAESVTNRRNTFAGNSLSSAFIHLENAVKFPDPDLSPAGYASCEKIRVALEEGCLPISIPQVDLVMASCLQRALRTAYLLFGKSGTHTIYAAPYLCEEVPGKNNRPMPYQAQIKKLGQATHAISYQWVLEPEPGPHFIEEVYTSSLEQFLRFLAKTLPCLCPGKSSLTIAVVGHGTWLRKQLLPPKSDKPLNLSMFQVPYAYDETDDLFKPIDSATCIFTGEVGDTAYIPGGIERAEAGDPN